MYTFQWKWVAMCCNLLQFVVCQVRGFTELNKILFGHPCYANQTIICNIDRLKKTISKKQNEKSLWVCWSIFYSVFAHRSFMRRTF